MQCVSVSVSVHVCMIKAVYHFVLLIDCLVVCCTALHALVLCWRFALYNCFIIIITIMINIIINIIIIIIIIIKSVAWRYRNLKCLLLLLSLESHGRALLAAQAFSSGGYLIPSFTITW